MTGRGKRFAFGSVPDFAEPDARDFANTCSCPTGPLHYEPMFASKDRKSSRVATRAADALDLVIEFATLGEYGLEYPEPVRSASRKSTTPDIRLDQSGDHRHGAAPQRHRHGRRPCRPGRTRVNLPGFGDRPAHEVPGVQPARRHKAATTGSTRPSGGDADRTPASRRGKLRNRPTSALPEVLRPPRIRFEAA